MVKYDMRDRVVPESVKLKDKVTKKPPGVVDLVLPLERHWNHRVLDYYLDETGDSLGTVTSASEVLVDIVNLKKTESNTKQKRTKRVIVASSIKSTFIGKLELDINQDAGVD